MAFCNDDLAMGVVRQDPNRRTKDCGCELIRYAATPYRPEGWYFVKKCAEHEAAA